MYKVGDTVWTINDYLHEKSKRYTGKIKAIDPNILPTLTYFIIRDSDGVQIIRRADLLFDSERNIIIAQIDIAEKKKQDIIKVIDDLITDLGGCE
jgi:hypothetical protein